MASDLLLPTGMKSLDDIMGGGLPVQGNILLYGDPLCGKKPLMMQFIYEGLKMNIPGIFVLTDFGFAEWKGMMEGSGWGISQFEQNGMLQVIDCYSKQFNPSLVDEGIVTYVDGASDLSAISMQLSSLQDQIAQIAENSLRTTARRRFSASCSSSRASSAGRAALQCTWWKRGCMTRSTCTWWSTSWTA